jgi:hypothetical protein
MLLCSLYLLRQVRCCRIFCLFKYPLVTTTLLTLPFFGFQSLPFSHSVSYPTTTQRPRCSLHLHDTPSVAVLYVRACMPACVYTHSMEVSHNISLPCYVPYTVLCLLSPWRISSGWMDGRLTGRPACGRVIGRPPDPYYSQWLPLSRSRNHSLPLSCLGTPHQGTRHTAHYYISYTRKKNCFIVVLLCIYNYYLQSLPVLA